MLARLISVCSLFMHIASACATINFDGVPNTPIDVCWSVRDDVGGMTYYKYICDSTGTQLMKEVHSGADCTDNYPYSVTMTLGEGGSLNCAKTYDCSYGIIRVYNDTSGQCLHDASIPYYEILKVVNECGYNASESISIQFRCNPGETVIYQSDDSFDTAELCDNPNQYVNWETSCHSTADVYVETECVIKDDDDDDDDDDALSTGAIVGIVVAIVAVLLIGTGIAVYCYYINRKKKDTKYSAVPKERAEEKQTKPIVVTRAQMQQPTQAPPPFRPQMQQTHETQPAPPPAFRPQQTQQPQQTHQPQAQQVPPSPPPPVQTIKEIYIKETEQKPPPAFQPEIQSIPFTAPGPSSSPSPPPPTDQENVSLIQNGKGVISDWLQQNAQISEIDANKYADIFIENGFEDLKLLKEITIDELVEIGISKLGHRKAIIKAIQSDEMVLQPIC